jgi:hypothetical protein
MTAVRELARYKLHLLGVQEVRWDTAGTAMEPGVDRRIILKWTVKKWDGGMGNLAQDRDR